MKRIPYVLRAILKIVLIVAGAVIIIMPFVPAFKEYFFNAPEKEFGFKEVTIVLLGSLIFTGGLYSNKMTDGLIKKFTKNATEN